MNYKHAKLLYYVKKKQKRMNKKKFNAVNFIVFKNAKYVIKSC